MPADVLDVSMKFMRDPIKILVKKEELTLEGKHFGTLCQILKTSYTYLPNFGFEYIEIRQTFQPINYILWYLVNCVI